jgi:aminopeptidase N
MILLFWNNFNNFIFFKVLAESPLVTLPASVSEIMYNWTMQSGYPVITVERDSLTNTATFTQALLSFYT